MNWQSHRFDLTSVRNIARGVCTGSENESSLCLHPVCRSVGLWKARFYLPLPSGSVLYSCPSGPLPSASALSRYIFCIFAGCLDTSWKMKGHTKTLIVTLFELICLPSGRQVKAFKVNSNYSKIRGQDLGAHFLYPHMQRPDGEGKINLQTVLTFSQHPPPSSKIISPLFSPEHDWCPEGIDVLDLLFVGPKGENTGPHFNLCRLLGIDTDAFTLIHNWKMQSIGSVLIPYHLELNYAMYPSLCLIRRIWKIQLELEKTSKSSPPSTNVYMWTYIFKYSRKISLCLTWECQIDLKCKK